MKSLFFLIIFGIQAGASPEVAVTVDDLVVHEQISNIPGQSPTQILAGLVSVFQKFQIPDVTGFVIGKTLTQEPLALQPWIGSGFSIGDHSFSHMKLAETKAQDYISDIDRNQKILRSLKGAHLSPTFRYPYLSEGETLEKRRAVRRYLQSQNIRVAQVTLDFTDWAWYQAYERCFKKGESEKMALIKALLKKSINDRLGIAISRAQAVFGRDIKHILLLHAGVFSSELVDIVLTELKSSGVKFITLNDAMSDPVYTQDPDTPLANGMTFQDQFIAKKLGQWPTGEQDPYLGVPLDVIGNLCW